MDFSLFPVFLLVSFGLIAIPGPNVLVIVSTSISHGRKRGLQTFAGTSLAMSVQLLAAGFGTTWLISLIEEGLGLLKWLGVAYLVYLGLIHLKEAIYQEETPQTTTGTTTFARGFAISLTNPKTLLFFSAFLPQFVSSPEKFTLEMSILSVTFLAMAILIDSCYAIFSADLRTALAVNSANKIRNGISGVLYLGAGVWLAAFRRM